MTAAEIRKHLEDNIGIVDENDLRNLLLGEIAAQLAQMNELLTDIVLRFPGRPGT